jgi:hypothetical protein
LKAWCDSSDSDIDNGFLVGHGLDRVSCAIFRKLDGAILSVEVQPVFADVNVMELVRGPEVWFVFALRVEYFRVKLASCPESALYHVSS